MKKFTIILVLAALMAASEAAMALDVSKPWMYFQQWVSQKKDVAKGWIPTMTSMGGSEGWWIYRSPGNDTYATTNPQMFPHYTYDGSTMIAGGLKGYIYDGFSTSNNISCWIDPDDPGRSSRYLLYSRLECVDLGLGNNTNIRTAKQDGTEAFLKFGTKQIPATGDSLGITGDNPPGANLLLNDKNISGFDLVLTDPGKRPGAYDTRMYFSSTKRGYFDAAGNLTGLYNGGYTQDPEAPWCPWGGWYAEDGSGYNPAGWIPALGHEADVLTAEIVGTTSAMRIFGDWKIFEHAWEIAAVMLRDLKAFDAAAMNNLLGGTYVWDTFDGQIEDTLGNAIAGMDYYNDFMRYVFDIRGLVVQDVDFDGRFDVDEDLILFGVSDDGLFKGKNTWGTSGALGFSACNYDGVYFDGNQVFLYRGNGAIGADVMIYQTLSGTYQIDALDIDPIPEPSTIILILGGAMGLAAGVIRKKLR